MIDLLSDIQVDDLGLVDTEVERAGNILGVQLGSLEYAPQLGIDLTFFLSPDFKFQNDSFKSYLTNVLANQSINVASIVETVETFHRKYAFNLTNQTAQSGLIAR